MSAVRSRSACGMRKTAAVQKRESPARSPSRQNCCRNGGRRLTVLPVEATPHGGRGGVKGRRKASGKAALPLHAAERAVLPERAGGYTVGASFVVAHVLPWTAAALLEGDKAVTAEDDVVK